MSWLDEEDDSSVSMCLVAVVILSTHEVHVRCSCCSASRQCALQCVAGCQALKDVDRRVESVLRRIESVSRRLVGLSRVVSLTVLDCF